MGFENSEGRTKYLSDKFIFLLALEALGSELCDVRIGSPGI